MKNKSKTLRFTNKGFVMLPVVITLLIVALLAFVMNRESGMNAAIIGDQGESEQTRLVAEAGLQHAIWTADNSMCTGYALASTNFGAHSYSASFTPTTGSPVSISATGILANGSTRSLGQDNIAIYETPIVTTLQPGASDGKDAFIKADATNKNYGVSADLWVEKSSGGLSDDSALLQFDLSGIPAGVMVVSAVLELYKNNGTTGTVGVHRVSSEWDEGTEDGFPWTGATWLERQDAVSWTTAGGDFDSNAVVSTVIGASNGWNEWDIATLAQTWIDGVYINQGMVLTGETTGTLAGFSSSDNGDATKHPKLTITYACECGGGTAMTYTLQPGTSSGKDAHIMAISPTENHGAGEKLKVGNSGLVHLLYKFDLSSLPAASIITSANLDLYMESAPPASVAGNVTAHRVSQAWVEGSGTIMTPTTDGASWNTHDGSNSWSSAGGDYEVTAVATTFVDISVGWYSWDVTSATADWVSGLQPNNGLLLRAGGATDKQQFTSSDDSVTANHPKLTINYTCPCGASCPGGAIAGSAKGWAVGDNGNIYYTADAGATWASQTSGTTEALYTVHFPTPLIGYAAGTGETLLKTTDGGSTWNTLITGFWTHWSLEFLDADTGYMVGLGPTLKMTTDAAANWTNQAPVTTEGLRDIYFIDAADGYFVGKAGIVAKTNDGGANWTLQNSTLTSQLYGVAFADASTGWAVGDLGKIINTTDGGATWVEQTSGTTQKLQGVSVLSASTAIAVGRLGVILKTIDGGATWLAQTSGTTGNLWHVHFVDTSTGYIAAQAGEILKTTDAGVTWTITASGTTETLRAIYFNQHKVPAAENGPLAHWKLDETTGTTAVDSVGGHDGTLINFPANPWTTGQVDGALDFDGSDDYVDLTSDAELDDVFVGGATVMAWIEPAGWGGNGYGRIFDKSSSPSSTGDGWAIRLNTDNGGLNFGQGFSSSRGWWKLPNNAINLNIWQHIAVAYDASSTANNPLIYINGSPVAVTLVDTPSGTLRSDAAINLRLGAHATGTNQNFDGKIDDARIYDRMLTATEIAAIAAALGGGGGGCAVTYADDFETDDYTGNTGSSNWNGNWFEVNENNNPNTGDEQVVTQSGGNLIARVRDNDGGFEGILRSADLSGYPTATLSFDYWRGSLDNSNDFVAVEVWPNATGQWEEVYRIEGPPGSDSSTGPPQSASRDISAFITNDTHIRFITSPNMGNTDSVFLDNIKICVSN